MATGRPVKEAPILESDLPVAVAARFERIEADVWSDIVQALGDQPGNPLRARIGRAGTLRLPLVAALDFEPFNRVVGLGVDGPADREQVQAIVAFYHEAGISRYGISLSPLARPPEVDAWLRECDLAPARTVSIAWRGVEDPPEIASGLRIASVGPAEAVRWAGVERAAWGMPAVMRPWFTATIGRPGWTHYLGFDGETAVTAGALFVSGDVGWLGFGATVPSHRRRGGHLATVARRIRDAAQLGCSVLVADTAEDTAEAPNPSYHNMLRVGFRLAYHRPTYRQHASRSEAGADRT